ncbi:hypothetical protein TEA_015223 [Camellia sinensis var. sinensis]|uniref:PPM-type phosphatase domain-containing protein n=1 Tax=Camellia sinensis var. sinensis TaxID=542762 RepID=A0A4S4EQE6_CAMSN|nr:hypothetical protein TEA_015223 [Camellia sinensis var. sinensis]
MDDNVVQRVFQEGGRDFYQQPSSSSSSIIQSLPLYVHTSLFIFVVTNEKIALLIYNKLCYAALILFGCAQNYDSSIPLSIDHKTDRSDKRQRIEQAGGFIIWAGTWRVGGVLAVSRAFGDKLLKPYVVAEPEIQTRNATGLVAPAIAVDLGALTYTLGTFVPVIGASGFATAAGATALGTVVSSFR